jgi:type IV pilus assembly protein PilE
MNNKTGFTLMEITVALIILGIAAAIALPSYTAYLQQGEAQNAQNNLTAIYGGQNTYYLNNTNTYYASSGTNDLNGINTALILTLAQDPYFKYTCAASIVSQNISRATGFTCTATNSSTGAVLTLTDAPLLANTNPSCAAASPSYCPPSL